MSLSESGETIAYKPAIEKGQKRLQRSNIDDIIHRTGLEFINEDSEFVIPTLNQKYYVKYPEGEIRSSNDEISVAQGMKIIILHFLIRGNNWPLSEKLISYKELPGGNVYDDAFQREAVKPILNNFNNKIDPLKKSAEKLGAEFVDRGDLGFVIEGLPTIPLTYILWLGDDELPGGANVLFDSSAITKLHTEDLAFLGQYITSLLLKFDSDI